MEEALIEVPTMRRFAGIELIRDRIPDETTILTYRHLLEKHGLSEQIFDTVKALLAAGGRDDVPGHDRRCHLDCCAQLYQEQRGKAGSGDAPDQEGQAEWYCVMRVYAGVDKDSGLIHSVVVTAANVHALTPAAELMHGDEEVIYDDTGYQGIAKRPEVAVTITEFRVAMRPGKRRALPDTPEDRMQDLIETAKAHIRSKGEHPFRLIKQQFGFQKTRLRGLAENRWKINVLAALSNLYQDRRQLLATA